MKFLLHCILFLSFTTHLLAIDYRVEIDYHHPKLKLLRQTPFFGNLGKRNELGSMPTTKGDAKLKGSYLLAKSSGTPRPKVSSQRPLTNTKMKSYNPTPQLLVSQKLEVSKPARPSEMPAAILAAILPFMLSLRNWKLIKCPSCFYNLLIS